MWEPKICAQVIAENGPGDTVTKGPACLQSQGPEQALNQAGCVGGAQAYRMVAVGIDLVLIVLESVSLGASQVAQW